MKVSSACRGECVATGGLCRPAHLCVTHLNCTKIKVLKFFFPVMWCGGGPCFIIDDKNSALKSTINYIL